MSEDIPGPHRAWGALFADGVETGFAGDGIGMYPSDRDRCECCHRQIRKLRPFGGPGDPLVGTTGALLVKRYRPDLPSMSEQERDDYLKKFGRDALNAYEEWGGSVGSSWECRDCIVIPSDGNWDKMAGGGEAVFPWADVEECARIREQNQRQHEESVKAVLEGRMVVISFSEEATMMREGKLEEFRERLHRENRKMLVAANKSDYQ